MAATLEKPGQWEPLHQAHAIEQVTCVVNFAREISDDEMIEIGNLGKQFKEELPGAHQLQLVNLTIGNVAPAWATGRAPAPAGYMFQRMGRDGSVESEVRCDRNSLNFRSSHYTRWADIWGRAKKYFDAFIPIYSKGSIFSLSLTFVDKFVWTGTPESAKVMQLLRVSSPYLSPQVYEREDLWHSHTGAFVRPDSGTKRLINLNVDCIDQILAAAAVPKRVVMVTSALSDMLGQDGVPAPLPPSDCSAFIDSRMQEFHALDKNILGDIINDAMSQRIALKSPPNV